MSQNQSRGDRIESSAQVRRYGRSGSSSGYQRVVPGGKGGGGGVGGGAGSSTPNPAPAAAAGRGYKKSGYGQGNAQNVGHPGRGSEFAHAAAPVYHAVQNGAHGQPTLPGNARPDAVPMPRNAARPVPKAPSSQPTAAAYNSAAPSGPPKAEARPFAFQFGTISPGFMNGGIQVPARTSSAPPNLDEQKRDQAIPAPLMPIPAVPVPSVPKQQQEQQTKKTIGVASQTSTGESHHAPQPKRDVHVPVPPGPPMPPPNPNVLPMTGIPMPMHMPFQHQQLQIPLQFGGPNMHIQPQAVAANSLQMTMGLPAGSASQVPQPMFVHSHLLQQQAMVHQGQGLGFVPPLSHQLVPQVGNLGIGIPPPPLHQQQPNKYSSSTHQKSKVKITHPETREELRLEKKTDYKDNMTSGQRSISNVTSQPHAPSYVPPHQMNFYSNMQPNFNHSQIVQMPTTSQAPRHAYAVNQAGPPLSFTSTTLPNNIPGGRSGPTLHGVPESLPTSIPPGTGHVTMKQHVPTQVEKVGSSPRVSKEELSKVHPAEGVTASPQSRSAASSDNLSHAPKTDPEVMKTVINNHSTGIPSVVSTQKSISGVSSPLGHEDRKKDVVINTESLKDNLEKPINKDLGCLEEQPQSDALNLSESTKVSSPKIIGDNSSIEVTGHNLTINDDLKQPISVRNPMTPSEASSLSNVQQDTSLGAGSSKGIKDLESPVSLSSSQGLSDIRTIQGANKVSSDASGLATDAISDGERSPSVSSSLLQVAETTSAKCLNSNQGENDTEEKRPNTGDISNKVLRDSTADSHPTGSMVDSSKIEIPPTMVNKNVDSLENTEESKCREHGRENDHVGTSKVEDRTAEEQDRVGVASLDVTDAEITSASFDSNQPLPLDNDTGDQELAQSKQIDLTKSDVHVAESTVPQKQEVNVSEVPREAVTAINSGFKEKPSVETPKPKTPSGKRKKKIKEILSKADAAGTSDLYNAYKGREEKQEAGETVHVSAPTDEKHAHDNELNKDVSVSDEGVQDKSEFDDWEDAAEASTPNLEATESEQAAIGMKQQDEDSFDATGQKKYSRDFLLTLAHQFIELPVGFQGGPDIDALMAFPVRKSHVSDREPYPSSGRVMTRSPGTSRADRRAVGNMDDGKWTKPTGPFSPGVNPRSGQGGEKTSRGSGILSGPLSQGGISRPVSDLDRWPRGNQRGLVPSPHTPMQVMHKADNKYLVGNVTDEEQAKQRQLKGILNKLTPQNFEKLFAKVIEVNIDNTVTLTGVISQIFDKALMEPTFCEMYADFCQRLASELPDFVEDNEKITFRRLLLNKCQEEFERGEREQEEANKTEEEGGIKQSEEEREEKRIRARRRMLGNIRLIGELYKKKMLTERIMHECIKKLLGQYENPDEEDLEALCKLMSTIGQMIDHLKAKVHMDAYFEVMKKLSVNEKLSPRVRFLLRDTIDLRKNKWQERRKVEGPKKIEEVHRDAAQERQAQSSRLPRGGSIQRRGPAVDYGNRGSSQLTSPSPQQQIGGFRGLVSQATGYGIQDVRSDERIQFERRTLPLPIHQRSTDDDTIALGPQGGLGRGMSHRGQPLISNIPPVLKDDRRMLYNQNGYNTLPHREADNHREELSTSATADRYTEAALNQSSQHHNSYSRDPEPRMLSNIRDLSAATSDSSQSATSVSDDIELQKKSLSALREFYSIKDEKEVALCIKELNAPNFYPHMISFWIIDSFERKDMERNLLAKLIVSLSKSRDCLFSRQQLIQGFENALSSLEDAVNDAPKAAEFIGRMFATIIVENVVPLKEIGRLIREGGEEPGRLREIGLAAEVLASILECIRLEKGNSVQDHILTSSSLSLGDFLPPHPMKTKLDLFLPSRA